MIGAKTFTVTSACVTGCDISWDFLSGTWLYHCNWKGLLGGGLPVSVSFTRPEDKLRFGLMDGSKGVRSLAL